MKNVQEQKIKLEQKKNRLLAEEIKLKLKERKMRTRHLIEIGGLIVKADLDHLATNTLYGALLSLKSSLETSANIKDEWTKLGKTKFTEEQQEKTPIILKFSQQPEAEIRKFLRNYGLKWNKFRSEWYGDIFNIKDIEKDLAHLDHTIEKI